MTVFFTHPKNTLPGRSSWSPERGGGVSSSFR